MSFFKHSALNALSPFAESATTQSFWEIKLSKISPFVPAKFGSTKHSRYSSLSNACVGTLAMVSTSKPKLLEIFLASNFINIASPSMIKIFFIFCLFAAFCPLFNGFVLALSLNHFGFYLAFFNRFEIKIPLIIAIFRHFNANRSNFSPL